jgi:hypothetical protein
LYDTSCEQKRKELKDSDPTEAAKLQYTFMGWDPKSLPLTAHGCGDEFPAFLTWKAGLDKTLIDMMRPEFDKGTRPEAFSSMLLELHAKNYTRCWLRHERELAMEKKRNPFFNSQDWEEFGDFDDESKWDGKVPSGAYVGAAYKRFNSTLRRH